MIHVPNAPQKKDLEEERGGISCILGEEVSGIGGSQGENILIL